MPRAGWSSIQCGLQNSLKAWLFQKRDWDVMEGGRLSEGGWIISEGMGLLLEWGELESFYRGALNYFGGE